ncbi:unnamed protein product [Pylaiella littoralis]
MKVSVCAIVLSQCCTAFILPPSAPTGAVLSSSYRSTAKRVRCGSSASAINRGSSSSSSSSNSRLLSSDRRRQRLPGGKSRVPGFALGAAKDWLKGGAQGKNGPERGKSAAASGGGGPKDPSKGSSAEKAAGIEGRQKSEGGDDDRDPRLYSVRIGRGTGIEWGTDISFSWVYVRGIHPDGSAANCGEISVGDQLVAMNDQTLAGAPFDVAMDAMIALEGPDVEFTFFRGTTDELKELAGAEGPPPEITVTVKQEGKPEIALTAPSGANLRDFLTENGINVYQSVTRWTNCKGKQLCGTCIVEINEGLESTTIRSIDESSTLRDNPANYRLSCVTNMYDDVTVTVFPPVGAAQWTR